MRRAMLTLGVLVAFASSSTAQIVPPAPGVEIPPEVIQSINERGGRAFQFENAWLRKAEQAREAREAFIEARGFYQRDMLPAAERPQLSVSGNFSVPVFCVKYSNTGADPYPISTLQTRLFDGPFAPRTLSEFYAEISYGDLNMTGTVYGWTTLPNVESFYTGAGTCNGLCGSANVDDLILTTLGANDAAVDFGQYDNDGPDGLPNSGDDDGFVDFVAFVHPEQGAECGVNGNIWSHRYSLNFLAGAAYTTNDARSGGGLIQVNDYVIQPAYNCGGVAVIDIGVFCHEFGHAFGLPDLYDTNGGSQGVGHWCLMGSGNWNAPPDPAHMSAWSKDQLGWTDIVVVDSKPTNYDIDNVENNRAVYRLDVAHERWRRMTDCKIAGNYSMRCGLLAAEATARNWASGSGYGNGWDETVSREFSYNGAGSVALSYKYSYDLEPGYDYAYTNVTVGGTTTMLAVYNGTVAGTANIDLTPYLGGVPTTYTISVRVTSDPGWSDEDGLNATACGAFVLDDISVVGGGENYATDFETREDGWAPDMSPPNEFFLVENRQPLGSDVNIWGGGGLAIWHIERSVASTGQAGNTGGSTNNRPRGVALEQADGLLNMEANLNRGDAGDPFPGSTNKTLFNGGTAPNSNGYGGASTVSVQLLTGNGDPISTTMSGGWPLPTVALWAPSTAASGAFVQVQIDGTGFARVGTAELVLGATTIPSTSVEWVGKDRILADFDLTGATNGFYDLVVFNPGGGCAVLPAAFEITGAPTGINQPAPSQFALRPNFPNPFNPSTTIRFDVAARGAVTLRVYDVSGALVRTLVNGEREAGAYAIGWDGRNDQGNPASSGVYFYRLTAGGFSDVRKMTLLK
jgi:M6 family metalloprotease-like protein